MPNQWQCAIAGVFSILLVQPVFADEGTSLTKGAQEETLLKPSLSHISPLDEHQKPCTDRVVQEAECKLITIPAKSKELPAVDVQHSGVPTDAGTSFDRPLALGTKAQPDEATRRIRQLTEIERPFTSADLLVQAPTPSSPPTNDVTEVTGVQANPTDKGVEVILQTTLGKQLQVVNRSAGNSYIADIPNAQLRLPNSDAFVFRSEKPITGITEITVTNFDANTIRVTVTGEADVPTVELFDSESGLIFSVVSAVASSPPQQPETQPMPEGIEPGSETEPDEPSVEGEEIEIVVTGEQEEGYSVPNASTATRTDTPLRDIPQSIQVVPQQVLEDRNVRSLNEAVETVSGVADGGDNFNASGGTRIIRGFQQDGNFRNGYRDGDQYTITPIGTIERVEVLKGPASVLFGAVEPGGIINTVTKQPLSEPYYKLAFEAGNYGFYQPSIDLSGPLNADKTVLYRFITSYQGADSYIDFVNTDQITIAPSITFKLGDRTNLNLYYEYLSFYADPPIREVPLLSDGSLPSRNFYPSYPFHIFDYTNNRFGYALSHEFSENLQIRNGFSVLKSRTLRLDNFFTGVVDDRFLTGFETYDTNYTIDTYSGQIDLLGKFKTGSVSHQLLAGFELNRYVQNYRGDINTGGLPDLDILNPNYAVSSPEVFPWYKFDQTSQSYGVYFQDQTALGDQLKLLVGGRYDWVTYEFETLNYGLLGNTEDDPLQSDGAFSPRIGLVYQPSKVVSLYTSYSRSFRQSTGFNPDGRAFEPTRGTQYEIGVRTDLLEGRLSTNLAAYHLARTNVTTPDPDPVRAARGFSVQVGEERSRGIELDVTGEISPGWNLIASYAYTDAEVTEDNATPVGNRLPAVPENQASLWTTYTIQEGDLRGLGFGLGLFYVGARQGDSNNSFQLDDYLRTDAALYYRRGRFNGAINIRNLFDIDYVAFSFNRNSVQRGDPFTIVGSISWEF